MKKGFTLAEMIAAIAILTILAALSVPFVRGYIDDSYNSKALIYMRELNDARMNFEKDYPGVTVTENGTNTGCVVSRFYGATGLQVIRETLFSCKYITRNNDVESRYTFILGEPTCKRCEEAGVRPVISMLGNANAGSYQDRCACMDVLGRVCRENADGTLNAPFNE